MPELRWVEAENFHPLRSVLQEGEGEVASPDGCETIEDVDMDLVRRVDRMKEAGKEPMTYEEHHRTLVTYLLAKVDLADWHGVSDAANDLRVLEAQRGQLLKACS